MIHCIRTNSDNEQFQKLVGELDSDLRIRDGEDHLFYAQFNKIDTIKKVIVAYENELPVGCGAIKEYVGDVMEVKRMYVLPGNRNRGIASTILKELECWAIELKMSKLLLETGINQPEAIALYKKSGYAPIPNYGQYENIINSLCFEKVLTQ